MEGGKRGWESVGWEARMESWTSETPGGIHDRQDEVRERMGVTPGVATTARRWRTRKRRPLETGEEETRGGRKRGLSSPVPPGAKPDAGPALVTRRQRLVEMSAS